MTAPLLSLYFFPFAGRVLPARLAFEIGHVAYRDERVAFDSWDSSDKLMFPTGTLPALHIGASSSLSPLVLCETQAIYRYAGHRSGLYPTHDLTSVARMEEVMKLVDEVFVGNDPIGLMRTFHMGGDALKVGRAEFVEKNVPLYFPRIESLVVGPFTTGPTPSMSDVVMFCLVKLLTSGTCDHVPADVLSGYPKCRNVCSGVLALPEVAAYFEKYPNEANGF